MKKKILSFACALAMALSVTPASVKAGTDSTTGKKDVYVLMNIPYDEFYKAETTNNDVKVDAFSSATKAKTRTGSLAGGSYHLDASGEKITGVIYPVKLGDGVTMDTVKELNGAEVTDKDSVQITTTNRGETKTVSYEGYKALFEKPSYSYYVLAEAPAYYKEMTVLENTVLFGKAQGEVTTMKSSSAFVTDSRYGDYQLNLDEELIEGYFNHDSDMISGVVITTTDNTGYGLRHLENIWLGYELAWCTGFTDAVHNCPTSSDHYKSIMGKTIDYVTYYTEKGIFKFDIEDIYVPKKFDYELSVSVDGRKNAAMTLEGMDAAAGYQQTYAVDGEAVTLKDDNTFSAEDLLPGSHMFTVSDSMGVYADLKASFIVTTEDMAAVYDAAKEKLVAAEGCSEANFTNYTKNITKVTVNDQEYAASGRGAVKLIDSDGTIVKDADPFAEAGKYMVTVSSTGYPDVVFEYEKKAAVAAPEDNTGNDNNSSDTDVTGSGDQPSNTSAAISVAKVKGVKVTGKAKKLKVSWKKADGVKGYQIQYSTSREFKKAKSVTVNGAKTVKATIKKGVKNGEKYYVRVCAYRTVNDKRENGKWSAVKSVKVGK